MNLQQHIIEWLDSLGADGLMFDVQFSPVYLKTNLKEAFAPQVCTADLVPAFRHADGSYHTEPESPCRKCDGWGDGCLYGNVNKCPQFQSWLAHKEDTK